MGRDASEELQRVEAELLAEEEPAEEPAEEDLPEELLDDLLEDARMSDSGIYCNFSNDYGKQLRNYASGYKAYNADKTDEDLESYSEAVRQPQKGNAGLVVLAVFLSLAVVAMLVCYLLFFWGVL